MEQIRHRNCNTSSVHSGTKSLTSRRMATIRRWRSLSWAGFATFFLLYTKTLIQPQPSSLLPPVMKTAFCGNLPRIQYAKTRTIMLNRHLSSTTTMHQKPQRPLRALFHMTRTSSRSFVPLSTQIHLPRPHMAHFPSMMHSQMRCC